MPRRFPLRWGRYGGHGTLTLLQYSLGISRRKGTAPLASRIRVFDAEGDCEEKEGGRTSGGERLNRVDGGAFCLRRIQRSEIRFAFGDDLPRGVFQALHHQLGAGRQRPRSVPNNADGLHLP